MIETDKYNLFYRENILSKAIMPNLSKVYTFLINLKEEEFINTLEKTVENEENEAFQLFVYYLILFRHLDNIKVFLNSEKMKLEILEKIILFTNAHCSIQEIPIEIVIDEYLSFINQNKILDLLLKSKHICRDKLLLFYLLTKLNTDSLKTYFFTNKDVGTLTTYFVRLPDNIMKSLIQRNYKIFQYFMHYIAESNDDKDLISNFFTKYKKYIGQISKLSDYMKKYKKTVDITKEKSLPFNERNMHRISNLIQIIRDSENIKQTIEYFAEESIFADKEEKEIIESMALNPVFKNFFKNYNGNDFGL